MDRYKYISTQQKIVLIAGLVKDLPLSEFINAINHAESVAPIFDPSLYMRGAPKMKLIKRIADGLLKFQDSIPDESEFVLAESKQRDVERIQGIMGEEDY